jgi:hypothetical protein
MISPTSTPSYNTSNIIYIRGGLEGAKNYPVTPGYTAWMIDEENKQFFIKTIGANGVPNVREFNYEEKNTQMQASSSEDSSKYATKEDFDKLYYKISKLEKSLDKRNTYKHNNYRRNGNGDKSYGKPV